MKEKYRSFEEAKKFALTLGLKGQLEWREYCKSGNKPLYIPNNPFQAYRNSGWVSWGDFLGTGYVHPMNRNYLPIKEAKIKARKVAKKLGIKTRRDWYFAYKKGLIPKNLPRDLNNLYNPQVNEQGD